MKARRLSKPGQMIVARSGAVDVDMISITMNAVPTA